MHACGAGFVCMHLGVVCLHAYGVLCMHAHGGCVYVCTWGSCVCMHMGVVCMHGVVCIYVRMPWSGVHGRLLRCLLCCCSFLSGHRLVLCTAVVGAAESVPFYQAQWKHYLCVLSTSAAR